MNNEIGKRMGDARRWWLTPLLLVMALALAGCGMFGGSGENESNGTQPSETRALVPTWTPTPEGAAPAPTVTVAFDVSPATSDQGSAPLAANAAPSSTSVFDNLTPEAIVAPTGVTTTAPLTTAVAPTTTAPVTTAAETSAATARLTVTQDGINVRTGPGTEYGIGGNASTGEAFDIIGKNQAGDWWQVCCVSGEPVWIFAQLATVENAENVQVAANIAAAPVVAAPVAAAPAPTNTPEPAPAEAPPAEAQPASDPCAGIGGDGCKFKLTGGPAFAPNGGGELKLTLAFIHSGIDGGQPQGSYFVVVLKDGQNVGVPDSVRSFDPSVGFRDGPNGQYNYEWKIGASDLPGGNIQGNYEIWVLDGNGERDSQTFTFGVPEGQGEVFIRFDQA